MIHFNQNKIDPELNIDLDTKNLPKEMKSWLTFLYENVQTSDENIGVKNLTLISYEKVIKQLNGDNLTSFRKVPGRVILAWLYYGGDSSDMDIISYHPGENKLHITREASRFDLLGCGLNKLFKIGDPTVLEMSLLFKTIIANV